eukprot:Amastigsp_a678613_83.p3 type:complete len:110 gc:universal Amastigsp_a678613_83:88-417(+)
MTPCDRIITQSLSGAPTGRALTAKRTVSGLVVLTRASICIVCDEPFANGSATSRRRHSNGTAEIDLTIVAFSGAAIVGNTKLGSELWVRSKITPPEAVMRMFPRRNPGS